MYGIVDTDFFKSPFLLDKSYLSQKYPSSFLGNRNLELLKPICKETQFSGQTSSIFKFIIRRADIDCRKEKQEML
jgi:hypothetical protein